jgi:hypothetical protein
VTSDIMVTSVESRPFIPFEMYVVDGRVFRVPHSDYTTMERLALAVVVYDDRGLKEIIDISLITSLKFLEPTS